MHMEEETSVVLKDSDEDVPSPGHNQPPHPSDGDHGLPPGKDHEASPQPSGTVAPQHSEQSLSAPTTNDESASVEKKSANPPVSKERQTGKSLDQLSKTEKSQPSEKKDTRSSSLMVPKSKVHKGSMFIN